MSTLIGYIKQELDDAKLRKTLLEVVEDVDALIPQNESESADVQKFGLYPAEECLPFVTNEKTPFYVLDNMALIPIDEPKERWMHYGLQTARGYAPFW